MKNCICIRENFFHIHYNVRNSGYVSNNKLIIRINISFSTFPTTFDYKYSVYNILLTRMKVEKIWLYRIVKTMHHNSSNISDLHSRRCQYNVCECNGQCL